MIRQGIAIDPRRFGQRFVVHARPAEGQVAGVPAGISDDLRLFATTFAAGFLFVSLLIA